MSFSIQSTSISFKKTYSWSPTYTKSLTQFPIPRFFAYVRASGGFCVSRVCNTIFSESPCLLGMQQQVCQHNVSFANLGTPCVMRTNHAHIICTPRGPPFGITKDFAAKLLQQASFCSKRFTRDPQVCCASKKKTLSISYLLACIE